MIRWDAVVARFLQMAMPGADVVCRGTESKNHLELARLISVMAIVLWICAFLLVWRVIGELGACIRAAFETAGRVMMFSVEISSASLGQVFSVTWEGVLNLSVVVQNATQAIWMQLTRDNLSMLIALGCVLYVFPDVCDAVSMMRAQSRGAPAL